MYRRWLLNCWILLPLLFSGAFVAHAQENIETLLVIDPSEQNPRNTEGDIVELKDGRLCLIYSRFPASDCSQRHCANLQSDRFLIEELKRPIIPHQ